MPLQGPQNLFILQQLIDSYEKKSGLSEAETAGLTLLKAAIKKIYDEVEILGNGDKNSQTTFPSVLAYTLQQAAQSTLSQGVIKYLSQLPKDKVSFQENKWDKAALLQRMHDYEQGDTIEIRIAAFKGIMTDIYKCIGTNLQQTLYLIEGEQKKAVAHGKTEYAEFLAEASRCFLGLNNRIALLTSGKKSMLELSTQFLPMLYHIANAFGGTLNPTNQLLDPLAGVERVSVSDFDLGFGQCVGIAREWVEKGKQRGKWQPALLVGGLFSLEAQTNNVNFFSWMKEPTAVNLDKANHKDVQAFISKMSEGKSHIFIVEGKDGSHVVGFRKIKDPTTQKVTDELFDSSFGSFYFTSHADMESFSTFYLNKYYRTSLFLGWPDRIVVPEKNTAEFNKDFKTIINNLPKDESKWVEIMLDMADDVTRARKKGHNASVLHRVFIESLGLMVNQMSDVSALTKLSEAVKTDKSCKFLKEKSSTWFWEKKAQKMLPQCLAMIDNRIKTVTENKEEKKDKPKLH